LKPREALDLIGFEWPRLGLSERLRRCYNVEDLRRLAARRTPRPVFDYVDGGADGELTLRRNREAFEAYELMPVGPADVSKVDPRVSLFGRRIALPLMCSPTGYTRMMHPDGELGVARAAGAAGIHLSNHGGRQLDRVRARLAGRGVPSGHDAARRQLSRGTEGTWPWATPPSARPLSYSDVRPVIEPPSSRALWRRALRPAAQPAPGRGP